MPNLNHDGLGSNSRFFTDCYLKATQFNRVSAIVRRTRETSSQIRPNCRVPTPAASAFEATMA